MEDRWGNAQSQRKFSILRSLAARIRLFLCFVVPVAGCVLVQLEGERNYGPLLAFAIAIGLFVYHYLQWALYETHRDDTRRDRSWAWQLVGVAAVGFLVRGNWKDWIIEQTFLEAVSFSTGIAVLSLVKAAREQRLGHTPPWFLVVLVFVAPAVALVVAILPSWIARHPDAPFWEWALLGVGFAASVWSDYRSMRPFAVGSGVMAEPLDRPWKTAFIVVWLILLMGLLLGVAGKSGG